MSFCLGVFSLLVSWVLFWSLVSIFRLVFWVFLNNRHMGMVLRVDAELELDGICWYRSRVLLWGVAVPLDYTGIVLANSSWVERPGVSKFWVVTSRFWQVLSWILMFSSKLSDIASEWEHLYPREVAVLVACLVMIGVLW